MDLRSVLTQLWPGGEAVVEPLGGGITNHNFKATIEGEAFVIRIGGKAYFRGGTAFWRHFGGTAAAQLFKGKWLMASARSVPSSTGGRAGEPPSGAGHRGRDWRGRDRYA